MIIDGTDLILGRLAAFAAKKALLGEKIDIVNCGDAVISGKKEIVLEKYKRRRERGDPHHGPYFPRTPKLMVQRAIRGMLPYKQEKGRKAYKLIKCYNGVPREFEGKKFETIEGIKAENLKLGKYITVKELSKLLGAH